MFQGTDVESRKEKSNRIRAETTRGALIKAARHLFAEKGFADTGTPEIVSVAGVTRGALHHHFVDKQGLFRAVIEREAELVAAAIGLESAMPESALDAMVRGAEAYFDAMAAPGRSRLLLLEGPAILGVHAMEEIDRRTGQRELREGLALVIGGAKVEVPLEALTGVLSAAFDKAALAIALGDPSEDYKEAIRILVAGIPGIDADAQTT
jgi:AcrR family transcriptional regulator